MTSAIQRWRRQVQAYHEQTERAREDAGKETDFWAPVAGQFRDDPSRADDPVLNRIFQWVDAETTVLDVGGGAGRYAVPLAKGCGSVTVVEPSQAMVDQLRAAASEAGVNNIEVVQENWETASVAPADLVLCAHVVYGVDDIAPFLEKLEQHARRRVVIVSHTKSPVSIAAPFWKAVHGEERVNLPALPELVPVLWEMGRFPDVEMFDVSRGRTLPDRELALLWLRRLTWVQPGSEKDAVLQKVMESAFDSASGAYVLRNERSMQGIVTWLTEPANEK
jgi:2-polyprenyl-3-methyl-5-hydroxy-6-metoxy-1,4-benzoquinol methylase